MAETITVDSVSVGSAIPPESVEWAESAYLGEVGEGHFTYEDTVGTKAFTGHKSLSVTQSSSSNSRIATGFVGKKSIKRGATTNRLAQRDITVTTRDLNDLLGRNILVVTGSLTAAQAGKRPAETVSARLTWLLASSFLSTLVADYGACTYSTATLDANDFRGSYPGDVLASMAKTIGFNYYVRYNGGAKAELVFRDDNTSTADTSTVSISNAGNDNATSIFAPLNEPELTQDPEHVYSGAYYTYSTNAGYATRAATATAFVARDGVTEDAGTKTATTAARDAEKFLDESDDEEQLLPVTLRMAKEYVGLVQAGQRISTRMTHFATEGWDPARYARILRKRITQPLNVDDHYDVTLDLSPQETPPAVVNCSTLYANTASGTYYPLGGPGAGGANYSNVTTAVVRYWRSGMADPTVPQAGDDSQWRFPVWGAGGVGTIDYAGDCVQNRLVLISVGNGTWTIQTERYGGTPRTLHVYSGAAFADPATYHGAVNAGDPYVVVISNTSAGDCIRITSVADAGLACGSKWGWSQAAWVAA